MKIIKYLFLILNLINFLFCFSMENNLTTEEKKKLGLKLVRSALNTYKFYSKFLKIFNKNKLNSKDLKLLTNYSINNTIKKMDNLLNNGADINYMDKYGYSALSYALQLNAEEIVDFLLNKGADINIQTKGWTPFMYAIIRANNNLIEKLIKLRADINVKSTSDGLTPLMLAVDHINHLKDRKEITKLLLHYGADVNAISNYGNVLTFATDSILNDRELLQILIDAGTIIEKKSGILKRALYRNKDEIINLFKKTLNNRFNKCIDSIKNNDYNDFKRNLLILNTVCYKDENKDNLLHHAIIHRNINFIALIWSIKPELMFEENKENITPWDLLINSGFFCPFFQMLLNN